MEKICLLDLEGTLVENEFLVELASLNGSAQRVSEITEFAMSGRICLEDAIKERIGLIKGVSRVEAERLLLKTKIRDGAVEFLKRLDETGWRIVVVTNGFMFFAKPICDELGIREVYGNELVFENGKIVSAMISVAKGAVAEKFSGKGNVLVAIGDGANDAAMFRRASVSFAFGNRTGVAEHADFLVADFFSLAGMLDSRFVVASSDSVPCGLNGKVLRFESRADLERRLPVASALVVRSQKIDASLIGMAPDLKVIIRQGVGTDNIDVQAASARGIEVLNTPLSAPSVAELTIGFMVNASRRIHCMDHEMKRGTWRERGEVMGSELFGKKVGIVGLGRIGSIVARICHAMGMRVAYYDPFVEETSYEKKFSLNELLSCSDIITFHVPLSPETMHLLNVENAWLVKRGAIVINTSRGKVIGKDALGVLLGSGVASAVCLDVHYEEPADYSSFHGFENLILTPHIGGNTFEAQERMASRVKEILAQRGFG